MHLIFQPAEEAIGGADLMIKDGLFEQFPCERIFGLHNMPGLPVGKLGFYAGNFMASADTVKITITGYGGHGAHPERTVDPIVAGAALVMALQSIVARNVPPGETAVVSVGTFQAGIASNVIPESAVMELSVRAMKPEIRDLLIKRIQELDRLYRQKLWRQQRSRGLRLLPGINQQSLKRPISPGRWRWRCLAAKGSWSRSRR